MMIEFHKCRKPDCFRKVSIGSMYCCGPCDYADQKGFELDESGPLGHSDGCNHRKFLRGEFTFFEGWANAQEGAEG